MVAVLVVTMLISVSIFAAVLMVLMAVTLYVILDEIVIALFDRAPTFRGFCPPEPD